MAKEILTPYDSADYLKTPAQIAAYMEAAMEEGAGDPAFVANALGVVARAQNMAKLARDSGMTREGLYKALSSTGNPSFATVTKVAGALGLRVTFQLGEAESDSPNTASVSEFVAGRKVAVMKGGGRVGAARSFAGARRKK